MSEHATLWLGLFPSPADAALLARPGGEAAERLHTTLVFLGKRSAADAARLTMIARSLAILQAPFVAPLGPVERFGPPGQEEQSAICLDAPELRSLRALLDVTLPGRLQPDRTWPYSPHLSLGAVAVAREEEFPAAVTFVELRVVHGDRVVSLPLRG
jgi:2'-5' RNA ligase